MVLMDLRSIMLNQFDLAHIFDGALVYLYCSTAGE